MTISQVNPPSIPAFGRDDGEVVRVGSDLLTPAASRLVTTSLTTDEGAAARFLEYAAQNRIALDSMFSVVDKRGRVLATALAVPNPGRTAMVFASRIGRTLAGSARQVEQIGRVIDHACRDVARTSSIRIAQALLEPRERAERQAFELGGFDLLATLSYLQRTNRNRPGATRTRPPQGVTTEPYTRAVHDDYLAAIDDSYEDTLDCPRLCGLRKTPEILAGHRGTGQFEPQLWTLLRVDGDPVGLLLLNPSPPQESIELVYLGLARRARGRGLGRWLLDEGLNAVADRPERTITLAVDESNTPASRLYFRAAFRRLLRRVALIRVL